MRAEWLVLDPDRRPDADGRRRKDPEAWSPRWSVCAERAGEARGACLKLPPAVEPALLDSALAPRVPRSWQWVSLRRELKEVTLWTGELATERRGAGTAEEREVVAIARDGSVATWAAAPAEVTALDGAAARAVPWIAEPDPTIVRAGLVGALAAEVGLRPLAQEIAFLGGAPHRASPFLSSFEVLGATPLDRRRVRALLARHDVGPLTVKKRGHSSTAEDLAKKFRGKGVRRGVLIVARLADGHHAYLVRPVPRIRSGRDGATAPIRSTRPW